MKPTNPSECCAAPLHFETLGPILVFRVVGGRKLYRCRCSKCGRTFETAKAPRPAGP